MENQELNQSVVPQEKKRLRIGSISLILSSVLISFFVLINSISVFLPKSFEFPLFFPSNYW